MVLSQKQSNIGIIFQFKEPRDSGITDNAVAVGEDDTKQPVGWNSGIS